VFIVLKTRPIIWAIGQYRYGKYSTLSGSQAK